MEPKKVHWIIFQTGKKANGGIKSAELLIRSHRVQDTTVVTNLESEFATKIRSSGVDCKFIEQRFWKIGGESDDEPGIIEKFIRLYKFSKELKRLWSKVRPAAVISNDPRAFWLSLPLSLLTKTPRYIFFRDTLPEGRSLRLQHWLIFHLTTAQLVLSESMARFWKERLNERFSNYAPRQKLEVVPSIVEVSGQSMKATYKKFDDPLLRLCVIGAFCEKKNQLSFIKTGISELLNYGFKGKLVFIGDFEPSTDLYAKQCKGVVSELGLAEFVEFRGAVDLDGFYLNEFSASLIISRYEGVARAMLEALASGLPVVSFNVSSARQILEDNHCGVVIEQGDYRGFATSLSAIFESPERFLKLSNAGRQYIINNHSADKAISKLDQALGLI